MGLLLVVAAVLVLPALGAMPWERAEIYFADGARAMVERGDWLVPYYRGEPFFDKPALTYWLIAASFEAFGFGTAAARVVPAGATLLTLLATLWLGAQLVGRRAALVGGLALVTTLAFIGFGRVAMSDMLLALFTNLSLALGVAAWRPGAARWAVPLLGAALGLGFLTKGPVALLFPGLGLLLLAWQRRRDRWPASWPRALAAVALFLVCGGAWWAAVFARLGDWPLRYFFLRENLERFAGATYDSGREPWFYFTTYLVQGAPWSLLLPLAAWHGWRRSQAQAGAAERPDAQAAAGVRLLLGWLALALVPLSLSRGKIDYYLLPLYPAASLCIGFLFTSVRWSGLERGWARGAILVVVAGLGLAATVPAQLPAAWLPAPGLLAAMYGGAGLAAIALLAAAWRGSPRAALSALAATAGAFFLGLVGILLPPFAAAQPNAAIVADVAREQAFEPGLQLTFCDDPLRVTRDLLFEQRLAAHQSCHLWASVAAPAPHLLLLAEHEWSLGRAPGMRHVATYDYLPATVLTARGLVEGVHAGRLGLFANFETTDPVAVKKHKREWRRYAQELERQWLEEQARAGAPPRPH